MGLKIKPVKQPDGKPWCGPACVEMVLGHFGIQRKQATIAEKTRMTRSGTYLGDLGAYILHQGLGVTLYMWIPGVQPRVMDEYQRRSLRDVLRLSLIDASKAQRKRWTRNGNAALRFAALGGTVKLEPIHTRHIESALERRWAVILLIDPYLVSRRGSDNGGHYVVPVRSINRNSRVKRPMIACLDPQTGRERTEYVDDIMHACHLWAGGGLIVYPKMTQ